MRIKSEWDFISAVRSLAAPDGADLPDGLVTGIGDDCAVFAIDRDRYGLVTTDLFLEDRHFARGFSSPTQIGRKAMEGSISDIAAMGAAPRFAFTSLGIPGETSQEYGLDLFKGLAQSAERCGTCIAGGDTSASEGLVISITIYGECPRERLVTRSGARTGQGIFVTGMLGGALAGLEILGSGEGDEQFPELVERHREPLCRVDIAGQIVERYAPGAMIDISDGLLSDLRHICESSGRGFVIDKEKLPLAGGLADYCKSRGKDPIDYGLESGEEFELLFTADTGQTGAIEDVPVTLIGEITEKDFLISKDGITTKAQIKGFDHFK
jgi:thiamine-monophosphate kinase